MPAKDIRPLLDAEVVEAIRARRPFNEGALTGYVSKGGSYIVATSGLWTDDGLPRDLLLVQRGDLDHGRVVPLYIATDPATVAYLEQELTRSNSTERPKACACVFSCADDPETVCSLSGEFHVHSGESCSVHPDAPGDR